MKVSWSQCLVAVCALVITIRPAETLKCYRCTSTDVENNTLQCNEYFDNTDLEPQSCEDIHDARYCIKQIGRFEAAGIKCFQCSSAENVSCSDLLIHEGAVAPRDCAHIFEAAYCIKMTGYAHGGRMGTKRDCSSVDRGNYCNYIRLTGDQLEYRSCYFTCTGDGCNSMPSGTEFSVTAFFLGPALAILRRVVPF